MRAPSAAILEQRCRDFNAQWPVGTLVKYHPVIGAPAYRERRIRTGAYVLSGHTAVLFLDGESGCVALDACEPIPTPSTPEAA